MEGPAMSAEDWDAEAAEMVEEVIKTQKDVADLLKQHSQATGELEELKNACAEELEELQAGTWKLQLYAELEKMRGQLHHLAPLAARSDSPNACAAAPHKEPAAGDSPASSEHNMPAEGDDGSITTVAGQQHQEEDEDLRILDDEIAAVNRQLEEAKSEMASMMVMKRALEEEIAGNQEICSAA